MSAHKDLKDGENREDVDNETISTRRIQALLTIAKEILPYYQTITDPLLKLISNTLQDEESAFAYNQVACDNYTFMVVSTNPLGTVKQIITNIRAANNKEYQTTLNPTTLLVKLVDKEFVLNMNGTNIMCIVRASIASNNLLKSIACKTIASVFNYANITNDDAYMYLNELHPDFDYSMQSLVSINGGRGGRGRRDKKKKPREKSNPRMDILIALMEMLKTNQDLAANIIFVNKLDDCKTTAMNILYTDKKYKDVIVNYMKLSFKDHKQYKFKAFLHNDFNVPYDFMLRKHSCLINDVSTGQATYIANLYNSATYSLIPCYSTESEKTINIAHPIIKLRFLYIDMFMVEHKMQKVIDLHKYATYRDTMLNTLKKIKMFDASIHWVGYYIDEIFIRNDYNLKSKSNSAPELFFI